MEQCKICNQYNKYTIKTKDNQPICYTCYKPISQEIGNNFNLHQALTTQKLVLLHSKTVNNYLLTMKKYSKHFSYSPRILIQNLLHYENSYSKKYYKKERSCMITNKTLHIKLINSILKNLNTLFPIILSKKELQSIIITRNYENGVHNISKFYYNNGCY